MRHLRAQLDAERVGFEQRGAGESWPWPLPMAGMFSQAKTAHVQGAVAEVVENLWSDGIALRVRDGYRSLNVAPELRQRIAFEFSASPHYIQIYADRAAASGASIVRNFPNRVMAAQLSANVVMADGAGVPLRYDGATIQIAGFFRHASETATLNLAAMDGVIAHHDRIYLWSTSHTGECEFWYGDQVGGVTGPLRRFPLGRLGNVRGQIMTMWSFSVDAGDGANDVLVILTKAGQVIAYEGFDPSDPLDWRLHGRYQAAPPLSRFSCCSVGPDCYVLTQGGVLSLHSIMRLGAPAISAPLTRAIRGEIAAAVDRNQDADTWQIITDPMGAFVLINVPDGEARHVQYVFGFEAQGWFRWSIPHARDWHAMVDSLQFTAEDGTLASWGEPGDDEAPIEWSYSSSWVRLRKGSYIACIRPSVIATGSLSLSVAVLSDFGETSVDLTERWQTITLQPERVQISGPQTIDESIPVGAEGSTFKLKMQGSQVSGEIQNVQIEA